MLPEETTVGNQLAEAAGALAGQGFSAAVGLVRDTHRALSKRVFDVVGLVGEPIRLAHDGISELAYALTAFVGDTVMKGAGLAAAFALVDQQGEIPTRVALGALNGAFGDMLEAEGSPLALEMTARVQGEAGPKLAVFIHGLCETEDAWFLYGATTYGVRLREALDYTSVYLRYNSGLPIEENGRRLARLLADLVDDSPVAVKEIVLIGHSMGGLVARAACHEGRGTNWGSLVKHLIALGVPHRGAPLEQAAALAARVLSAVPETRAFGEALDARSIGIKDMHGVTTTPYVEEIDHYFFSTGLHASLDGSLGDLLVRRESAWDLGRGEKARFGVDRYRHLSGTHHFDLLGHPAIAEQLIAWLRGDGAQRQLVAG
jgi:pimeloyl-ACP methyl ester carboxylesterase